MSPRSSRAKPHGHAAPRPTLDEILAARTRLEKVSADFLKVDMETALVFSKIALQSEDQTKRERNQRAARRAYDTIVRLMTKIRLNERDGRLLTANLERLKSELMTLGEVF